LFADARYLIAVEDEENGMLGGSITALAQVTADKYGRAEIPGHIAADEGQHLNLYGACSHRSAHLTEDKLLLCEICGKRLPAVLDLGEPKPEPEALTGDVNGDGKVNGADAGILNRYTSGWTGYADRISDMKAADINGDGKVNGADSGILNRHTSGWTGYDKYFN
ncbi:MAG: dockerin type I repeat-containing protein, partial [Ruminococcus sp.]|nr:dockerin type I repeat-containing protein [Ruminococcus sp.]